MFVGLQLIKITFGYLKRSLNKVQKVNFELNVKTWASAEEVERSNKISPIRS